MRNSGWRQALELALGISVVSLFGCSPVQFANEAPAPSTDVLCTTCGSDKTMTFAVGSTKTPVDILFVIDNSLSMATEISFLSARFSSFTATLSKLDWQICMTTVDAESLKGGLLPIAGLAGRKVLKPSDPAFDSKFMQTLAGVPTNKDDAEQGIKATNLALRKAFAPESDGCFRKNASLAVVQVSDEDELNDGWAGGLGHGLDPRADNYPASVIATVDSVFGSHERFSFNGFAILPGDLACRSTQRKQVGITAYDGSPVEDPTWGHYGLRLTELATLSGGHVHSVCSDDYGNKLTDIAKIIESTAQTMTLECDRAEVIEMKVSGPSSLEAHEWNLSGNVVTLESGFQWPDVVTLRYRCL